MTAIRDLRVLVVEDDFYIAIDVERTLQNAGAVVVGPYGRVEDALAAIAREPIDCALVDVNLGDGPNFEVAQALRERGVSAVFTTGYGGEIFPEEFQGHTRLEKPVHPLQMVAAVAQACGQ